MESIYDYWVLEPIRFAKYCNSRLPLRLLVVAAWSRMSMPGMSGGVREWSALELAGVPHSGDIVGRENRSSDLSPGGDSHSVVWRWA